VSPPSWWRRRARSRADWTGRGRGRPAARAMSVESVRPCPRSRVPPRGIGEVRAVACYWTGTGLFVKCLWARTSALPTCCTTFLPFFEASSRWANNPAPPSSLFSNAVEHQALVGVRCRTGRCLGPPRLTRRSGPFDTRRCSSWNGRVQLSGAGRRSRRPAVLLWTQDKLSATGAASLHRSLGPRTVDGRPGGLPRIVRLRLSEPPPTPRQDGPLDVA